MIPVLGEKLIDHCCMDHYKHLHDQQGEEAASASTNRDPCAPGGLLCGPVRPSVDYGADIDLTKGWLGEKDPKPCCPCRGKGARLINYGDYPGGGFYNTYTMELCRSVRDNLVHCLFLCGSLLRSLPEFIKASVGLLLANAVCMHVALCKQRSSGGTDEFRCRLRSICSMYACVQSFPSCLACQIPDRAHAQYPGDRVSKRVTVVQCL